MPLLVFLYFVFYSLTLSAACPNVAWDQTATLKLINDGDTITLQNGNLVRLIGINTPEINYRKKSKSAPYSWQAKALLERYIKIGDKVHLVFDKKKRDKYGRKLAYVYSKTGRNLALLQLQSGLAKQWVVGKNDRFWLCFQAAELQARLKRKGVWSDFVPLSAHAIAKHDLGFQYIGGEISDITRNKNGVQFLLDEKLKVRVSAASLKKFKANNIDFSVGQKVLLTGRVTFSGVNPQLRLYHPVQVLPLT